MSERVHYLSGPMSGYPEHNYPAFKHLAKVLRDRGMRIESPHENPAPRRLMHLCRPTKDSDAIDCPECGVEVIWRYYMRLCKDQVERCDSIIMMPGWPESRGARQELEWALNLGHTIFAYDGERRIIVRMSRFA